MQILKFTCKEQILTAECPGRLVIAESRQHVFAQFELDSEWDGLAVTAIFSNDFGPKGYAMQLTGSPVEVPPEVLVEGRLRVSLEGLGNNGQHRLTTAYMNKPIMVYRAGDLIGLRPEDATPELWEQVLAIIGPMDKLATSAKQTIVDAINEIYRTGGGGGGSGGREIELNVINGYIVWRYVGDADWKNLIALSDLEGDPGAAATIEITAANNLPAGSAPTVTENTGSTAQKRSYTIGIPAGRDGTNGRGVSSIVGNPDGSWTVEYTDDTTETVSSEAYAALKSKVDKAVLTDAMALTAAQQAQVRANIAAAAAADLASYYRKNETYSQAEIDARISAIPKFSIKPVTQLPSSGISATTVYLVRTAVQNNLYMEYIFVPIDSTAPGPFTDSDGAWEPLGAQTVDLTGYATEDWANKNFQPIGNYVTREEFDALTADVAQITVQIGDIDTALDGIISIQNSYINGGGAE